MGEEPRNPELTGQLTASQQSLLSELLDFWGPPRFLLGAPTCSKDQPAGRGIQPGEGHSHVETASLGQDRSLVPRAAQLLPG